MGQELAVGMCCALRAPAVAGPVLSRRPIDRATGNRHAAPADLGAPCERGKTGDVLPPLDAKIPSPIARGVLQRTGALDLLQLVCNTRLQRQRET
ncbi:Protein of unknown function [Gryllus bimaculatus]|nr:Protein of unknown function [Gryllus bimaculatus]